MKLRNGFISNSSSSSFILELPKPIEEYSLEEFREMLGENSSFDPVKHLYENIKQYGKVKLSDWEQERFNRTSLADTEYIVSYGNEACNDGLSYENESFMECDFMPYLDIVKETYNNH